MMKDPKNAILGFIKTLVPKVVYKTINLLLSPCCDTNTIKTIAITGLNINGVSITNKEVRIIILTNDSVGQAIGTVNGSGDLTIS